MVTPNCTDAIACKLSHICSILDGNWNCHAYGFLGLVFNTRLVTRAKTKSSSTALLVQYFFSKLVTFRALNLFCLTLLSNIDTAFSTKWIYGRNANQGPQKVLMVLAEGAHCLLHDNQAWNAMKSFRFSICQHIWHHKKSHASHQSLRKM